MEDLLNRLKNHEVVSLTIESVGVLTNTGIYRHVLNDQEINKDLLIKFLEQQIKKDGE